MRIIGILFESGDPVSVITIETIESGSPDITPTVSG